MSESATSPADAALRRAARPLSAYAVEQLPEYDPAFYTAARRDISKIDEIIVPPRRARCFSVSAGSFFRINSVEGPQVGDLNLWHKDNLKEHFYSGKTRQLHRSHVSTGDRLWSNLPYLRTMATITEDSLAWYGIDDDGGSVHDVIGTRCDPYTNRTLKGVDYHYCCHSNLTRALARSTGLSLKDAEWYVHDVMNVFMCTGFSKETHRYFMKASPVRPGDYIEFFAEIDLLVGLSACPGGDCGSSHSDDAAPCHPLLVEIFQTNRKMLSDWQPATPNSYSRSHGVT